MLPTVLFLGSHPALSAAEAAAFAERIGAAVKWDTAWCPVALLTPSGLPSPAVLRESLGGTTMVGTLRATLARFPTPAELLSAVPELRTPRQGKLLIGLSARRIGGERRGMRDADLARRVKELAMSAKRVLGMKGTRVVFPPARRPDLSTAQLLHNRLPKDGAAVFLLVRGSGTDLVTVDAIQDITGYARRDRARAADPARGLLPPKLARILVNLSRIPPTGTLYDPFCGVGTIPAEACLLGYRVVASDKSPQQVARTRENITRLSRAHHAIPSTGGGQLFVHDVTKGPPSLPPNSVNAVVTEGWLGPARTRAPLPREAADTFASVGRLLLSLFRALRILLAPDGRVVLCLPAFRVERGVLPFPLDTLDPRGFQREPLLAPPLLSAFARDDLAGTLLYGRPDAIVLRQIVRFRRRAP